MRPSIVQCRWRILAVLVLLVAGASLSEPVEPEEPRPPKSDAELRSWLENMFWHHHYSPAEISAATGLTELEVNAALHRLGLRPESRPRPSTNELRVLPYPGGRHPRLGFFEGAIRTQRETKLSVFLPWENSGYVVVDVPEAIFTHLGLVYLAHTHVPTLWDTQGVTLPKLEWVRSAKGAWESRRTLPNGIAFGVRAAPVGRDAVAFRLSLTNGTAAPLTAMRAQVCVMLGRAMGFSAQTNLNKRIEPPLVACQSEDGRRWILTAWEPLNRAWANPPVPCLHSDPALPDCPPGESREARGWLWFYEGDDPSADFARRRAEWMNP